MNHSPADVIGQYLIDQGTFGDPEGSALVFPLYVNFMPDALSPEDNAACIFDTEGVPDGRLMSGEKIWHHGVQIRIRSTTHTIGWQKAQAVSAKLSQIARTDSSVGASDYILHNVSETFPPMYIGIEEATRRRYLFVVNALATLEQS